MSLMEKAHLQMRAAFRSNVIHDRRLILLITGAHLGSFHPGLAIKGATSSTPTSRLIKHWWNLEDTALRNYILNV